MGPDETIQTLVSASAARGEVTTMDGKVLPMFKLSLRVLHQGGPAHQQFEELPALWMQPEAALALAVAIRHGLDRQFPELKQSPTVESPGPMSVQ